jgi:hypothetical protein
MAIATLPLVLSVVLTELAVGGAFLMWFVDRGGRAPGGFLKLVGFVDIAAISAALALAPTFPRGELAERVGLEGSRLDSLSVALSVLLVFAVIQLVTAFFPVRGLRNAAGVITVLAGFLPLGIAATAPIEANVFQRAFAIAALPLGAIALGGSDGAMLLGHWYLVTPKLSPAPLQRAALVVVAAVALQLALVTITALRGDLTGSWETALTVALAIRIGVGLLMTLIVSAAAWWTARMNTQSSTGLLYVALGCVFAGEVSARVIFFLTGVSV